MTCFVLQPERWWYVPKCLFSFPAFLQTSQFLLWKLSQQFGKDPNGPFGAFIMYKRKKQGQKNCLVLSNTSRQIPGQDCSCYRWHWNQQSAFAQRSSTHTNLDLLRSDFQGKRSSLFWSEMAFSKKTNSRLKSSSSAVISRNPYGQYFQVLLKKKTQQQPKLNGLVRLSAWHCF